MNSCNELQIGPRTVLRPGDCFRARGGPYFHARGVPGSRINLAERGPFRFLRFCTRGGSRWVEALNREGCFCVLALSRRRAKLIPSIVNRPYVIVGRAKG